MFKKNRPEKPVPGSATPSRLPGAYDYRVWDINWRAVTNIVLLFLTLEIAFLSVERARWIDPQPSLTLTLVIAVLVAWWLARRRLPGVIVHVIAALAGALVILWQAYHVLTAPGLVSGFSRIVTALQSLWRAADTVPAGAENVSFTVFLVLLTWLIGYISTWFLVRRHLAWVGVALGALVILVNLSNLPDGYYFYLGGYFLAAVLLVAHVRMVRHPSPAGYSRRGWVYIGLVLLGVVFIASTVAWYTPQLCAPRLQTLIATRMLWKKNVEESPLNIFSTVPSKQPLSTSGTHREQAFEKEWHSGDKIDFFVRSERPSYWRVHVYDVYTARGWENSQVSEQFLDEKAIWGGGGMPSAAGVTTYTVSANLKTDIVLMAGKFISADNPSLVEVSAGDVVAVKTPRIFQPGEEYTVTSLLFTPSPAALSQTGGVYPPSITASYLQLPLDFPDSIRQLSANVTRDAATPYEKVLAVIDYLAKIPYSTKIEAPSGDKDMVQYFLFEQKSGFCLYYASAMAVMLRSVGVPSRLAVGYLPGEPGQEVGEYILRDKSYHAWPEVYFPGYGWIDLEPTPGGEGTGVTIASPWVSEEAIAQSPEWDVWLNYPPPVPPDLPAGGAAGRASGAKTRSGGPFFLARPLGLAMLIIITGALILAVLATPVLLLRSSFYRWLWNVDRDRLASLAYDKMCRLAAMVRLGPRPQQTPLEFAAELSTVFPEQAVAFHHIARTYVENRFGGKAGPGLFEEAELLKARCGAFDVLLKRLGLAGKITRGRL